MKSTPISKFVLALLVGAVAATAAAFPPPDLPTGGPPPTDGPPPPPPPPDGPVELKSALSDAIVNPGRPDNASNRSIRNTIERTTRRIHEDPPAPHSPATIAPVYSGKGVLYGKDGKAAHWEGPSSARLSSVYTGYTYINTRDSRLAGLDGDVHSGNIGVDFFTHSDILLGFLYSYSDTTLSQAGSTASSDAHFFSVYGAKQLRPWMSLGTVVGYGTGDTSVTLGPRFPGFGTTSIDNDTWHVAPFLNTYYHLGGPWSLSTSTSYQYTDVDSSGQHALTLEVRAHYAATDRISLTALARYFQELSNQTKLHDDNWITVGGRLNYAVSHCTDVFVGYEYDAMSDHFDNHSVIAGVSFDF